MQVGVHEWSHRILLCSVLSSSREKLRPCWVIRPFKFKFINTTKRVLIYHSDYELWEIHYPDGGGLDAIEPEEFEELMIKTNNGEINVFKLLNDKCLYKMSDCDHIWFNELDWKWE